MCVQCDFARHKEGLANLAVDCVSTDQSAFTEVNRFNYIQVHVTLPPIFLFNMCQMWFTHVPNLIYRSSIRLKI